MRSFSFLFIAACLAAGCSSPAEDTTGATSSGSSGAGGGDAAAPELRGQRYCEVLAAKLSGATIHIDVFNTIGLNDCPEDAWSKLDPAALAKQLGVSKVVLNGPRYWLIDRFDQGSFIDPTPVDFGGISMRLAGSADMPASETIDTPYVQHAIQRDTVFHFDAGKPVYELVDPDGKVYDMQSYSIQLVAQTEADLATLGQKLTLPAGFSYRARTLDADLTVTAVNGTAIVVQDERKDTYQESQQ